MLSPTKMFWWLLMPASAVAFVAAGCVGDAPAATNDAGSDAAVDVAADVAFDAGSDAGATSDARCDPAKPFGPAETVAEINTNGDDLAAWLTSDELTAYWVNNNPDGGTVHTATRSTNTQAFPTPTPATDLTGPNGTNAVWLTPDGLTALVNYTVTWQLELGSRASTQAKFSSFVPLTSLNGGFNFGGTLRGDGKEIFFASVRSGPVQIYVAQGTGSNFGAPAVFNQAAASSDDGTPILSADGLTLYFSSTRPGGAGGADIWVTRRASLAALFDVPDRIAELATSVPEEPTWISTDQCILYFDRGTVGSRDIYRARRPQ